ncbi:MAG: response regulator [Candidatus Kapabacteria bacterium]|nr:response regulator [Candidatus Kapabacteria bacterium]
MNLNILFIDDEPEILSGYKRMLYSMKKEWNQFFCASGSEAFEVLQKEKIDVVISDLRMPQMNGIEVLTKVKSLYPDVIRLVLSGQQNDIQAIQSTGVAHQFLSKPCDAELLKRTIDHAMNLRTLVGNESVRKIINGIGDLPLLPDLYIEIESELSKREVSIDRVLKLISNDIPLVAKMMQIVNSSFFGLKNTINNLDQALNFLGINMIKSIIVHYYVFSNRKSSLAYTKYCEKIGSHSIKVASIAKEIAFKETGDKLIVNFSFMAGILHDLGKIILYNIGDYETKVNYLCQSERIPNHIAEYELYGFTHAEVGAYLLGIWGLSDRIVEAVACHHNPSKLNENRFTAVSAVHIANIIEKKTSELTDDIGIDKMKYLLKEIDYEYFDGLGTKYKIIDYIKR